MLVASHIKYQRILDSLEDIAECTQQKLVLVGGTALAIFYLKHRASQDLDFVPFGDGNDVAAKELLKGALSKKGYTTLRAAHTNQFVLQFDDTTVKVEVFLPDVKLDTIESFPVGGAQMRVARLDDLFEMKLSAYKKRKEARDLYDIVSILTKKGMQLDMAIQLLNDFGSPLNLDSLDKLALDKNYRKIFHEVLKRVA